MPNRAVPRGVCVMQARQWAKSRLLLCPPCYLLYLYTTIEWSFKAKETPTTPAMIWCSIKWKITINQGNIISAWLRPNLHWFRGPQVLRHSGTPALLWLIGGPLTFRCGLLPESVTESEALARHTHGAGKGCPHYSILIVIAWIYFSHYNAQLSFSGFFLRSRWLFAFLMCANLFSRSRSRSRFSFFTFPPGSGSGSGYRRMCVSAFNNFRHGILSWVSLPNRV